MRKDCYMDLITIENLRCSYDRPYTEGLSRVVLEIKGLSLKRGKKVFIVGESGIGKSTILETLGMMNNTIVPDKEARFYFQETDGRKTDLVSLWTGNDDILSQFRLKNYSFIFQSTNLMRNFTAYENVAYTRMLQGYGKQETYKKTRKLLADLGLEHVSEVRMAQELSGGQQQRLAFARAILPDFTVLFGDEPTGNLDPENAERVMRVLVQKIDELKDASAIIVSHDMKLATAFADVIVKIRKEVRPKQHEEDDDVTFGVIDDSSVYVPDSTRSSWTNGKDKYNASDFEEYLRKK